MTQNKIDNVEKQAVIIDEVVNTLVNQYCEPLDKYMDKIADIFCSGRAITDDELDLMALKLPNLIYFTSEAVETLGIREDIANAIKINIYNDIHMKTQGTVADKKNAAELATQEENLVQVCYDRAYKKIKQRMEAGYEQLNSIKKVLSRRVVSMQLTLVSNGAVSSDIVQLQRSR